MPRLVDSHSHIHLSSFNETREDVLRLMREQSIWTICIGTTSLTSKNAIVAAEENEGIFAAVGHHPEHFTNTHHFEDEPDAQEYDIEELERLARSSKKVVAIGETGLDLYRVDEGMDTTAALAEQERVFREHLSLAAKLDLPVAIHCREALTELARIVADVQKSGTIVRGVVHCYTGTWAEAEPLLALGLHLSFTGIITFPPKKGTDPETQVQRVIERMPLERLLIETDAPFLAPIPHRGETNQPAFVTFVAQKVAELRNISVEEVEKQTTLNAVKLFRLDAR